MIQTYTVLAREFGGQVSMGEGSMEKEVILQSGVLSDYCVQEFCDFSLLEMIQIVAQRIRVIGVSPFLKLIF